jgi:hypothetical protein
LNGNTLTIGISDGASQDVDLSGLAVGDNWGSDYVHSTPEFIGNGTSSYPLSLSGYISLSRIDVHDEIRVMGELRDGSGDRGASGEYLASNGTTVEWATIVPTPGDDWGNEYVHTDATLTGDGTPGNELHVASGGGDDWGSQYVMVGSNLTGKGLTGDVLDLAPDIEVNNIDASISIITANLNAELIDAENLSLTSKFYDVNGDEGASGEILSSTGNGVDWIPAPSGGTGLWTDEGNYIRVESNKPIKTQAQLLEVYHQGVTSTVNYDASNFDIGSFNINTTSTLTVNINGVSIGSQGTLFLYMDGSSGVPSSINIVCKYSNGNSMTNRYLSPIPTPVQDKIITITYTGLNSSDIALVFSYEQ